MLLDRWIKAGIIAYGVVVSKSVVVVDCTVLQYNLMAFDFE